ncbi:hypothetical protein [Wolbachia endosymbiont of Litomosoides sigmodontis]|uniref:hypothetical protein n=1 Tax=Wolbachia endosymbiont of Litomosoides sigmodontis TaxID=80850 RepID=UPI001C5501D2|nr:hypothetical protein [Wolbachia endosymbiont of Litomosoides sigmodontis]
MLICRIRERATSTIGDIFNKNVLYFRTALTIWIKHLKIVEGKKLFISPQYHRKTRLN